QAEVATQQAYVHKELKLALGKANDLRQQIHKKLADIPSVSVWLSNPDGWEKLLNAAQALQEQAAKLAGSRQEPLPPALQAELANLEKDLKSDWQDYQLARKLDDIRLEAFTMTGSKFDEMPVGPRYAEVFADLGLDLNKGTPEQLAVKIKSQRLLYILV